jgi:hypothetical protein
MKKDKQFANGITQASPNPIEEGRYFLTFLGAYISATASTMPTTSPINSPTRASGGM